MGVCFLPHQHQNSTQSYGLNQKQSKVLKQELVCGVPGILSHTGEPHSWGVPPAARGEKHTTVTGVFSPEVGTPLYHNSSAPKQYTVIRLKPKTEQGLLQQH